MNRLINTIRFSGLEHRPLEKTESLYLIVGNFSDIFQSSIDDVTTSSYLNFIAPETRKYPSLIYYTSV